MSEMVSTKDRLLAEAARIFAGKGFQHATVAEICEAAEANIAAVNYHFGDKENLYREVWSYLFDIDHGLSAPPESHADCGPEAWLRMFIRSRLELIYAPAPAGLLPRIIFREMGENSPAHAQLFKTHLKPIRDRVRAAIAALLGEDFSGAQIELATINFMGIHIFINFGHQRGAHIRSGDRPCFPDRFDKQLMQQIENFAIGGLMALKG